jgi:hypothetical protein
MRVVRKFALAMLLATSSVVSQAATYFVELKGTVTSQVDPGSDANIGLGDTVTMTARFNDSRIFDNGTSRYANFFGLPADGDHYWNVKLNDLTWKSRDDELDGYPVDFDASDNFLQLPYIELLSGGGIGNPEGSLVPVDTNKIPIFNLGTGHIRSGDFLYGNTYVTPGFNVTWDLAGAKLTEVPEPSIWAMTIIGFGMVGAASRKRSRLRTITC